MVSGDLGGQKAFAQIATFGLLYFFAGISGLVARAGTCVPTKVALHQIQPARSPL